jgi:hypothetical protein
MKEAKFYSVVGRGGSTHEAIHEIDDLEGNLWDSEQEAIDEYENSHLSGEDETLYVLEVSVKPIKIRSNKFTEIC